MSNSCAASKKCLNDDRRRARLPAAVSKSTMPKAVVCIRVNWGSRGKGRQSGCTETTAMPAPHCFNRWRDDSLFGRCLLIARHMPVARFCVSAGDLFQSFRQNKGDVLQIYVQDVHHVR